MPRAISGRLNSGLTMNFSAPTEVIAPANVCGHLFEKPAAKR